MRKRIVYPKGTKPRLYTPPLRPLNSKTSKGFRVIRFARRIGAPLLPWQQFALVHGLELRPDGRYRFKVVLVIVGRQNGKTSIPRVLVPWRMLYDSAQMVLGTSATADYAREAWRATVRLVEGSERLAPKFTTAKWGAGQEELPAINGARYKLAAASRRGGRSLSVDLGIADELREHKDDEAWAALIGATVARPNAQIWALTTMSDDSAVVLNDLRARALAYIERGEGDDSICLLEWSGPEDCEVTDRDAWRMANPALASPVENTITEATLASNLATMSQERFRIEHLCQRVASMDTAVDLQAWEACSDPGTLDDARDRVALCLDVSPDLAHVTLAAAATLDDGRARVEVARAWESTDAARQELPALVDRIQPRTLGWFPNGPGASLAADLKRDGMEEIRDVPAVCMGLAEQVIAQRVVHSNDPLLSTQVSAASKLAQGDAWRFTRKGSGHVDAVYATAGALHLARTLPPIEEPELPPRIYVFDPDEDALIA